MSAVAGTRVLEDVRIGMRDGVHLVADVYLPEGEGPWPVLLERTPYNRRGTNHADRTAVQPTPFSKPQIAAQFVQRGFAYVLQDCRGRYGSGGTFTKYVNEGKDGVDTLNWILEQAWCNGNVGTLGLSYSAHTQAAMASLGAEGLGAMWMDSGGFSSAYHSGIRQGGAFELKQLTWAFKHARLSPLTQADPARRAALENEDIREWVRVNPWRIGHSPLSAAPEYEAYVVEQWANECFGPFWSRAGLYARGHYDRFPDIPAVFMASWFDPYALTATENYTALSAMKRSPMQLLLGPWCHGQRSVSYAGDVDFGAAAILDGNIAADYIALRADWFSRVLNGTTAAAGLSSPVTLFVMGGGTGRRNAAGRLDHGGQWMHTSTWPPEGAAATSLYLADGALLSSTAEREGHCSVVSDPLNPVPTIGGATASGAPVMEAGAFDQRETSALYGARRVGPLAERDDVVVFRTSVLDKDLIVAGPVSAELWVSSSAVDGDIMLKLIDEYPPGDDYPDGYAMNLSHGVLRLRFRNGFDRIELMEPGAVYRVRVQLFPTANRFVAGHRLRLDIAGSNFPHFDVNPHTGAPAGEVTDAVVATHHVHWGAAQPSRLELWRVSAM